MIEYKVGDKVMVRRIPGVLQHCMLEGVYGGIRGIERGKITVLEVATKGASGTVISFGIYDRDCRPYDDDAFLRYRLLACAGAPIVWDDEEGG